MIQFIITVFIVFVIDELLGNFIENLAIGYAATPAPIVFGIISFGVALFLLFIGIIYYFDVEFN